MNKTLLKPKKDLKFEAGGNKKYKIEAIIDSVIYNQYANNRHQMPGLYYLVL